MKLREKGANMEKALIEAVQANFPRIFSAIKKYGKSSFSVDYDEEANVFCISFNPGEKATEAEIYSDDVILRKKGREVIGITLLHASEFLGQ